MHFFTRHRLLIAWILISGFMTACIGQQSSDPYSDQRLKMVQSQIKARGVNDPEVLLAMENVPRHLFVPASYRSQAYGDFPLPIGSGQTISQPYIVALMTEVLDIDSTDKILEIGTGSGYQAAVLAELCKEVYTIEVFELLGKQAEKTINALGYKNVHVRIGDGYAGWPEEAPFDAIIVTCAPTHVPQALKDQLKEGGRMVIPVGEYYAQELVLLSKIKGRLEKKDLIPVRFVPMINEKGKTY
ncbi:MAG: protein-L-isoaspartate(D-aspartate) O-methyltransferase [Bacteroidetes bacterium]|nr:protein-L-isoaspartate(D-aspartate) O-methyltransferase [Bacteroidota bacterium]